MSNIAEVESLAFQLSVSERATLASRLLESLPEILSDEDEGVGEAMRRRAELQTNPEIGITLEELHQRISEGLGYDGSHTSARPFRCCRSNGVLRARRRCQELAADLYREVEEAIETVRERPLSFPVTVDVLRRAAINRFPFHLLFSLEPSYIFVLVVRHNRRHPDFGLDR